MFITVPISFPPPPPTNRRKSWFWIFIHFLQIQSIQFRLFVQTLQTNFEALITHVHKQGTAKPRNHWFSISLIWIVCLMFKYYIDDDDERISRRIFSYIAFSTGYCLESNFISLHFVLVFFCVLLFSAKPLHIAFALFLHLIELTELESTQYTNVRKFFFLD